MPSAIRPLVPIPVATLLLAAPFAAGYAAEVGARPEPWSRVDRVTLYGGQALVERVKSVPAGVSNAEFRCLPALLDRETLRTVGPAELKTGDIRVRNLSGVEEEDCRRGPLDDRIRALEDALTAANAEVAANDLQQAYVKSNTEVASLPHQTSEVPQIVRDSELVHQAARTALLARTALDRRVEEAQRQLDSAKAERARIQGAAGHYVDVRVAVDARAPAELRLLYLVQRAGWSPAYRAALNTSTGQVKLDRLAWITNLSGETWNGVHLVLSTGAPNLNPAGPIPQSRVLSFYHPEPPRQFAKSAAFAPAPSAPAPARLALEAAEADQATDQPVFEVHSFDSEFSTSYDAGHGITLSADGQRVSLTLTTDTLTSQIHDRAVPRLDPNAYLLAHLQRPQGEWPAGPLRLERDGEVLGTLQRWSIETPEAVDLSFGRDPRMLVKIKPTVDTDAQAGFIESRQVKHQHLRYEVTNHHRDPVDLEVLEASPVSSTDQIEVQTQFSPQVTSNDWEGHKGVVVWRQSIAPEATLPFEANYVISAPKDGIIQGQ